MMMDKLSAGVAPRLVRRASHIVEDEGLSSSDGEEEEEDSLTFSDDEHEHEHDATPSASASASSALPAAKIPRTHLAAIKHGSGPTATLAVTQVRSPDPTALLPDQILVKVQYSGLCASDVALLHDRPSHLHPTPPPPLPPSNDDIFGHEGVGTVVAVGENMRRRWRVGQRAGIASLVSVCRDCAFCRSGEEMYCPRAVRSGVERPGTWQEYVVTDGRYAAEIPDTLPSDLAAPLLCAGAVAYAALRRSNVRAGQWLVVSGAGGGLGHLALQYARALNIRTIAIDTGDDKAQLCARLGAERFLDYGKEADVPAAVGALTGHGAHAAVIATGAERAFREVVGCMRAGGTVVSAGVPRDGGVVLGAAPGVMSAKGLSFVGAGAGGRREVEEALEFAVERGIRPVLVKGELRDVQKYVDMLDAGQVAGRVVLQVSK